jgi:hypothetical protein
MSSTAVALRALITLDTAATNAAATINVFFCEGFISRRPRDFAPPANKVDGHPCLHIPYDVWLTSCVRQSPPAPRT